MSFLGTNTKKPILQNAVKYKIKRDDQVVVISGKEKGKTGKVTQVMPKTAKVVIEKLNMVKKHLRPSEKFKQGGIIDKEAPMSISNVKLICEKCKGPVRIGWKFLEDNRKVRACRKCGEVLDK